MAEKDKDTSALRMRRVSGMKRKHTKMSRLYNEQCTAFRMQAKQPIAYYQEARKRNATIGTFKELSMLDLTPELLLTQEQIEECRQRQVLTSSQLLTLHQQIDSLRRINVNLRHLKHYARSGQALPVPKAQRGGGSGRGGGRGTGVLRASTFKGRGRGRGRKRGREDEDEKEDFIIADTSSSSSDGGSSRPAGRQQGPEVAEQQEAEAQELDAAEVASTTDDSTGGIRAQARTESASAASSESEEDWEIPPVLQPRRSGRARRTSLAVAVLAAEAAEDDSAHAGSEGLAGPAGMQGGAERAQLGGSSAAAAPEGSEGPGSSLAASPAAPAAAAAAVGGALHSLGASEPAGVETSRSQAAVRQRRRGGNKAAPKGGRSSGMVQRGLFRVVQDSSTSAALRLPALRVVQLQSGSVGGGGSSEEDAVCSVCGDQDASPDNVILLCEGKGCSVAVHQACYGVARVPAGEWLCSACTAQLKPQAANCCVCPVAGGALKKVASLGRVVPAAGSAQEALAHYCHLACALWVPELELCDGKRMEGVRLDKLTAVRSKLRCELCKQGGGGAVQCSFGTCCRAFHVLCARAAGQLLTFRSTDGEPLAFCQLHSKQTFKETVNELVEGVRPLELQGAALPKEDQSD